MRVLATAALLCAALAPAVCVAAPYRAAILDDPTLPVRGCATPAATIRAALEAEGVAVTSLTAAAVCDPARLNADRCDLLVVPTGATYPAAGRDALVAFLKRGGDLLCTGGYAFDHLVMRDGGQWRSQDAIVAAAERRAADPSVSLIPNGDFARGADGREEWAIDGANARTVDEGRPPYGRCAEVTSPTSTGGSRFATRLRAEPGRTYAVGADARTTGIAGQGFGFLAVYQYDRAGALVAFRDFAQIRATTGWKRYTSRITVDPRADRVMFHAGVYLASGAIRFDRVTWAPVPDEARINAHWGEPMDGLVVQPEQLMLYSPDQPIEGVGLFGAAGAGLPAGWRSPGAVRGFEATAQLRAVARWTPLVEARDRFGRPSGVAGALVRHSAGTFAGSQWALFGVTNRDVLAGESGRALLRRTVRLLRGAARIDAFRPGMAIHRPGETAALAISVADNGGGGSAAIHVRLRTPEGRAVASFAREVSVPAGGKADVTIAWPVPAGAPDFVVATAELAGGGEMWDRAETGFCVYSDRVMRSGPHIVYRRNAFEVHRPGKPPKRVLLNGTDTWGSMFTEASHSPLTWYRDLRMMRDHGLHMFENLQYSPARWTFTETQWRQLDALIQLSQRFGLPYMAGLLIGQNVAIDDATLAAQARMCGEFARRYRGVPGLIYYLNGDFRLDLADTPDMRVLWNAYLAERHRSADALRAVWGPEAVPGQMAVPGAEPTTWLDRRAQDLYGFKVRLMRRWIDALVAAIRAEDPDHPITSEYYQRPTGGIDLRLTMGRQDASNIGYFDAARVDIAKLPATIKWNDMRLAGKTVNLGEFGVKTHDAWARERDPSGYHVARTELGQRELFWWVVHAALAHDVTKIQNWCFADDPDTIFPWGAAWRNPLRAKPALRLWRNLRVLSDRVPRADTRSPVALVLPDTWRQSAPESVAYARLMNAIECLLATGVPFDVANEADIASLAARPPRVIVAPLAYALPDAAIARLRQAASRGCTVLVSGDPAVCPDGTREPARLSRLCGVSESGRPGTYADLPMPTVTAAAARAFRLPGGIVQFRHRVGTGAVWFTPTPWEALPGFEPFVQDPEVTGRADRNLYLTLLPAAGVAPPAPCSTREPLWRTAVTPAGSGRLVSVFPRGASRPSGTVTVRSGTGVFGVTPDAGMPCTLLLDAASRVTAATGAGTLSAGSGGRPLVRGGRSWMAVALDARPLDRAGAVALTAVQDTAVWCRSALARPNAWVVEWRDGRAVRVAPLAVRRMGGGWQVDVPATELALVCPAGEEDRWLRALWP